MTPSISDITVPHTNPLSFSQQYLRYRELLNGPVPNWDEVVLCLDKLHIAKNFPWQGYALENPFVKNSVSWRSAPLNFVKLPFHPRAIWQFVLLYLTDYFMGMTWQSLPRTLQIITRNDTGNPLIDNFLLQHPLFLEPLVDVSGNSAQVSFYAVLWNSTLAHCRVHLIYDAATSQIANVQMMDKILLESVA